METSIIQPDYRQWLYELKERIKRSQIKATVAVNSELIQLYWNIGKQIVEKQKEAQWGDGLINQLSKDPYHFDFLSLTEQSKERDIEKALVQHLSQFLLELGKGFAYMGQQYLLHVGTKNIAQTSSSITLN